jgi:hypothetical protein
MITAARVKELMNDEDISDEEAEAVLDACRCMAELLLEAQRRQVGAKSSDKQQGAPR